MTQPAQAVQRAVHDAPRLAVVVPIYRHSVLLAEAIESVLAQRAAFGIRLVLVDDGCPHAETRAVCSDYARAYPDRIIYLRKPNGGLSDARNCGIRHALSRWASIEAVYLLDADNRLRPEALGRAMAALDAAPEAGWIYPNIDMFGTGTQADYGGDYSPLIHTAMNISEAGSLISRRVFDAGIYFDTDFKLGFEDWDFFVSAGAVGFSGVNLEDFGFQYRKRPESMLADSERDRAAIFGAMRLKHKAHFSPRSLVAMEAAQHPRYAIWMPDREEVLFTLDPDAGTRRVSWQEYEAAYWQARIAPTRHAVPPFITVMKSGVIEELRKAGILHWVLWSLENLLREKHVALLTADQGEAGRLGYRLHGVPGGRQNVAAALMMPPAKFYKALADETTEWIDSLTSEEPKPDAGVLELRLDPEVMSAGSALSDTSASLDFLLLIRRLRASQYRPAAAIRWDWRKPDIAWRNREFEIPREEFDGFAAYPKAADGRRHVGFVLPLVEFGGVEKVALNVAQALKARGWTPHLFVVSAQEGAIDRHWRSVFESINFLGDPKFDPWGGANTTFAGIDLPGWAEHGQHRRALGLLYWLDAVINTHGGAFAGLLGALRRQGVTTVNSLHLHDRSPAGRLVGNSYLGLAYEHAFDLFAPCSLQLADWCHAMGVPSEKIVPVPNAPGFPDEDSALLQVQQDRRARDPDTPLRVLFLGRIDRQKGLHRLTEAVKKTGDLNLDWRIIGKSVLADGVQLPEVIAEKLEPPLHAPEDLRAVYAWADVLVLLSEFEGLPLTILEAMRAGVVPVVTDVGANDEVLRHDQNGMLLPLEAAAERCVRALTALSGDREHLRRLSDAAFVDMQGRSWFNATQDLHAALLSRRASKSEGDETAT